MSTIAITSLPIVTTGTVGDVIPIVQNGVTSQITNADLFNSVNEINGVALGIGPSTSVTNTTIGNDSFLANTTGNGNVAVGADSLKANTTGISNVAVGFGAMIANVAGSNNVAVGLLALGAATGSFNTGVGRNAGGSITSGAKNTIIGNYSGAGAPISLTGSNYVVLSDGDGNVRAYWNGADATFNGALTVAGNVLVNNSSGKTGYTTGAGGTVTQATSRTTAVLLNKPTGAITLFSAAGTTTATTFTVSNNTVAATDVIILNQKSGTDLYDSMVTAVALGSFNITFRTTGGTTTETPVFSFAVISGAVA